jgi:hypothetical protein
MHIDRANKVTVAREPARSACPSSAFGLVAMPTYRTLARCSSFGASEAHDVSLFRFVSQVVDIFAVFPQAHPLVVMPSVVVSAHAVGIADEKRSHLLLNTEVDHFSCGLMPQITDPSFPSSALLVFSTLQFLPATGVLLATGLLAGNLSQVPVALPFQRSDPTPRDNESFACVGGHCCKVDFAQVYGCLHEPWGLLCLWHFDADVQFKSVVPYQCTGSARFSKIKGQHNRLAPLAHGQDHPSFFFAHCLSRPEDGVEAFATSGIFHLHLRMGLAKLAGCLDIGKEGMNDHLNRLAMQGKAAFGRLLQFVASRPALVGLSCLFMLLHAQIPDLSGFHLGGFQSAKLASR